jgi:hypothetical protein
MKRNLLSHVCNSTLFLARWFPIWLLKPNGTSNANDTKRNVRGTSEHGGDNVRETPSVAISCGDKKSGLADALLRFGDSSS